MADDISNVLILNRKSAQNQETQIFATELEKFRPYQTRLLQMAHKQSSLMKELTAAYGDLLQDKRIRAEQNKYESLSRQRNSVLSRFKKTHQAFLDITTGLGKARDFYREMKDTVESLEKNVETFVNNRRNEGAQLLAQIENDKGSEAEREHKKLREMVERISVGGAPQAKPRPGPRPAPLASVSMHKPVSTPLGTPSQVPPQRSPPNTPMFPPHNHNTGYYVNPTPPPPPPGPPPVQPGSAGFPPYQYQHSPATTTGQFPGAPRRDSHSLPRRESYNQLPRNQDPRFTIPPQVAPPMARRESHTQVPASPPPNQITHHPYQPSHYSSPPNMFPGQITGYPPHQPYNPSAYGPTSSVPPPPPGPPPLPLANGRQSYSQVPQGYQPPPPPPPPQLQQAQYYGQQQVQQQQQGGDPWAGLSPWKQ